MKYLLVLVLRPSLALELAGLFLEMLWLDWQETALLKSELRIQMEER